MRGRDRALSGEGGELSSFFDGSSPVLCGADRPSNPLGRQFSDEGARALPARSPRCRAPVSAKRRWTPSGAPREGAVSAASELVAAPWKLQKNAKTSFSHLATRGTPKISQLTSPPLFFSPPQFPSPAAFTLPPSAYVPPDEADTMSPPVMLSRTPHMQPARPTARRLAPVGRKARALSDEHSESSAGDALPPRLPQEQGVVYDAMHGSGGGGASAGGGSVLRPAARSLSKLTVAQELLAPLERFGL